MITISNFEKYVLPQILMRGEDYYESDAVLEIEEESPGEWIATVCGTENYEVTVSMEGNEIIAWECDCPYDGTFVNMWWLRFWQFVTVEAKPVVSCQLRKQIHSWGCWERICPKL